MKRLLPILLLVLTALLVAPMIAQAQKVVPLEPTKYGEQLKAFGDVSLEIVSRDKTMEIFTLAVHADIPNRDALSISVVTTRGVFEIGSLRMLLTMGNMEKWNTVEPSEVFPVEEILSIIVRHGKEDVLIGSF